MESMDENLRSIINETLIPLSPIPTGMESRGGLPGSVRAVLFDIYGTLLISGTGDIGLASMRDNSPDIGSIMKETGFTLLLDDAEQTVFALMDEFIRKRHQELKADGVDYPEVEIREIWAEVLRELGDRGMLEYNPESTKIDILALRHELSVNPVWPMPGFPGIISKLVESGMKVGIVSNAQFYTPLILEAVSGKSLDEMGFDRRLCAWSYMMNRAKPSPEVFSAPVAALESMGISAGETLYVGNDMLNDVAAASLAGCRTALFAGDQRSLRMRDGDKRAGILPDMVLTGLNQFENLINGGFPDGKD